MVENIYYRGGFIYRNGIERYDGGKKIEDRMFDWDLTESYIIRWNTNQGKEDVFSWYDRNFKWMNDYSKHLKEIF